MDQRSFGILAHNYLRTQLSLSGPDVKAHEVLNGLEK